MTKKKEFSWYNLTHSKFITINGNTVELYDERPSVYCDGLEGAKLDNIDGNLVITGDEIIYGVNYLDFVDDVDINDVVERDIRIRKKYIFFGPKIKYIKDGWFEYKKRKFKTIILSEYKIVDHRL